MFHTVAAVDLQAERDVFMGMPSETTNKQTFLRVPLRSSHTESPSGDKRTRVQFVDGNKHIVQSVRSRTHHGDVWASGCVQGLRRLLIRFPMCFVPGIKVFEASNENDRTNLSMGFALYDYRNGPTPEEQRVMDNIDGLAAFLRSTLVRCPCDKLQPGNQRAHLVLCFRRMLKLDTSNVSPQVAAEMLDLHVARPVTDRAATVPGRTNAPGGGSAPMPSRYCYVKLIAPDPNVNEVYHTYFWTTEGKRVPFDTVRMFRNFHVQPFVEVEDIFVSKAMRSLQLKLRECLVVPPVERMQYRPSVCFPDRVCVPEAEDTDVYTSNAAASPPPVSDDTPPLPPVVDTAPVLQAPTTTKKRPAAGDDHELQPAAKRVEAGGAEAEDDAASVASSTTTAPGEVAVN